jgi:hypothetical protein
MPLVRPLIGRRSLGSMLPSVRHFESIANLSGSGSYKMLSLELRKARAVPRTIAWTSSLLTLVRKLPVWASAAQERGLTC